jgi:sodium/proline symporter
MIFSILSAFLLYFLILVAIAAIVYHKNKRATDFMLGGRSTNYFVTALAAQASDMSSWLFLAFPAAVFLNGLFELWTAIGLIIFMYLNWTFIAPALRVATQHYNSLTLTSYLAARFHDSRGLISLCSAFFSLLFFTVYIASGLIGIGRLFNGAFDLNMSTSVLIGLGVALAYTLIGGFLAVAWCNVFKGIFMLAVIVAVPFFAVSAMGGLHAVFDALNPNTLTLFPAGKSIFASLFLACGWGLGYFGQPHILIYFMSIDDVKKIVYSKYIGLVWMALALTAATSIGLLAQVYFGADFAAPETLFIAFAKNLFNPFFAGVALCGIFAATLATMNNHILISGSVISEDLYKRFISPTLSQHGQIWISRLGSVLVCVAALAIVFFGNSDSIYKLVSYAWSGLGSSFGPVLLASLYSNKVSYAGALSSIIIGGITAGLWPFFNIPIMPLIPGFGLACIALILGSYLFRK